MDDGLEFDFTEEELFSALRLAMPEDEARAMAREAASAIQAGGEWGTSDDFLLLLDIGSESGSDKVTRLRRTLRQSRFSVWARDNQEEGQTSAAEIQRQVAEAIAEDERQWADRREELRDRLRKGGKLPHDRAR